MPDFSESTGAGFTENPLMFNSQFLILIRWELRIGNLTLTDSFCGYSSEHETVHECSLRGA